MDIGQVSLLTAVVVPVACASAIALAGRRWSSAAGALAVAGSTTAFGASFVLLAVTASSGTVEVLLGSTSSAPPVGLSADTATALIALLVTGVLAVVQSFSRRYLGDDLRRARFFGLSSLTSSATLLAASATTLSGLALGWVIATAGTCLLLAHRLDIEQGRSGSLLALKTLLFGDCALVAAVALVLLTGPDLDLRDPSAAAADLASRSVAGASVGSIVAGLLVICALARSAQFPMHRWLPATLTTPTPVSAMLHAGIVNGAGLLLIALAPIVALEPGLLWLLLAAGITSAVVGTGMSLVRSDVKGSLAWSTSAQMGFMVAQCAVGAFAAALFHMFGHGLYKATLFLGSGSALDAAKRSAGSPVPGPVLAPQSRAMVAAGASTIALGASTSVIAPHLAAEGEAWLLLAFAWLSAAHATWSWLGSAAGSGRLGIAVGSAALVGACATYVAALGAVESITGPGMPDIGAAAPPVWVMLTALGAAAAAASAIRIGSARSSRFASFERRLYMLLRAHSTSDRPRATRVTVGDTTSHALARRDLEPRPVTA